MEYTCASCGKVSTPHLGNWSTHRDLTFYPLPARWRAMVDERSIDDETGVLKLRLVCSEACEAKERKGILAARAEQCAKAPRGHVGENAYSKPVGEGSYVMICGWCHQERKKEIT